MNVDRLLEQFTRWMSIQADVRGMALVGSHARNAATETSDVDLMILTTNVSRYVQSHDWITMFGDVAKHKVEHWGAVTALRVFYKDASEVEYNFALPEWANVPTDAGTQQVVSDGMRILFDPDTILQRLQTAVATAE
ncbi:MAG: nucleotidyltransferase domain-containing protein [Chloroflexota bacterium]